MKWTRLSSVMRIAPGLGVFAALALQGCFLFEDDKDPPSPASRGFYYVSFPTYGTSLDLDSSYQILWTPSAEAEGGNVRISLYQGEDFKFNLASTAPNSGAYTWLVSNTRVLSGYRVGSGGNYRLRFTSTQDTGKWDFGGTFSIHSRYTGSLTVTAPGTGNGAKLDSSLSIRWASTGEPGTSVGIQLYKDTVLVSSVASQAPNNGYYLWSRVTSNLGSGEDYRIRVFSMRDPSIQGRSQTFRISSAFDGKLELTSPKSGDTLAAGNLARVAWSVTGNAGSTAAITLYRESTLVRSVATATLGSADSASWTVTSGLATGSRYRLRMVSSSDAGIQAWSGFFSIKGSDPDGFENDDSVRLAKAIPTDGKAQQRTITYQDIDWLRFSSNQGKRYLVSVRGTAGVTAYAADSAGNLLNASQSGSSINLLITPAYAGRHHLRISSYTGYGPYSVAITEYDSTESSAKVAFSAPDSASVWAAGSSYPIKWTPDSLFYGTYVNLSLFDDTTLTQTINISASNSGTYTWSLPSSLISSSKYRIRIASYQNTQVYSYSPYFTISGLSVDAYEPDNQRIQAKALAADGAAQSRSLTSGDHDWIRIDAKAGKKYLATFASSAPSHYVTVMDSAGRAVGSGQSGSQLSVMVNPTYDGAYYLQVQSVGSHGAYTVVLAEYESVLGGLPGNFSAPDSASTWASGSSYAVTWTPDVPLFGSYVSLALYQDSAFIQDITSSVGNTGTYSWSVPTGLATSSRYRLRIANINNGQIYGYSPPFAISGISPDAFETDNHMTQAKDIALDGAPQNRNHTQNDSDWVKFDGAAGKSYLINVAASHTVYLHAMDSLRARFASSSGTRFPLVVKPTRNGTVYVRCHPGSGAGAYTLSAMAYEVGPHGFPAEFIAPDSSSTWATGTSYTVSWTPDTLLYGRFVALALYSDTALVLSLASSVSNTGSYTIALPNGLASGSKYRLRLTSSANSLLYGSSEPFTLSGLAPDSYEPNDTSAMAKAVTPNQARQTLSLTYRDSDWFKFSATAGMLYLFQAVSGSSLPTIIHLHSGLGVTQIRTNIKTGSVDSVNSMAWVCPADGEYSFGVEAYPHTTSYNGSYDLEFKEVDPSTYKFTVTSPAQDASVKPGQSLLIQWTDPSGVKGFVDLFLYNTEGVVQTIAANQGNTGSYTWPVPATLTSRGGYYVRVLSRLNGAISGSSGNFSIAP